MEERAKIFGWEAIQRFTGIPKRTMQNSLFGLSKVGEKIPVYHTETGKTWAYIHELESWLKARGGLELWLQAWELGWSDAAQGIERKGSSQAYEAARKAGLEAKEKALSTYRSSKKAGEAERIRAARQIVMKWCK